MPLILLAENEAPTIDHVRSVLASQGWLVKTVKDRDQALRAASEFAPQLVLVNDRLSGVDDLVRTFSRHSGGPGVILLADSGEDQPGSASAPPGVEAVLHKPLETENLIYTIRKGLADAKDQKPVFPAGDQKRIFSSEEIFGDLLDDLLDKEVAAEAAAVEEHLPEAAAPAPPKSVPVAPRAEAKQQPPAAAAKPQSPAPQMSASAGKVETGKVESAPQKSRPRLVDAIDLIDLDDDEKPATLVEPPPDLGEPVVAQAKSKPAEEKVSDPAGSEEPPPPETVEGDDLADLEEVVRMEVSAWADSVETETGEADARARQEAPEPEMDVEDAVEVQAAAALAAAASSPATRSAPSASDHDLETRLNDTLAGVLAASLTQAGGSQPTADSSESDEAGIEALLSRALGDLKVGSVPRKSSSERRPEPPVRQTEAEVPEQEEAPATAPPVVEPEADAEGWKLEVPWVDSEPDQPKPVTGEEFGEYTLEQRIGIGGMAEVWKARRKGVEGFEKRVAIKRILPQAAENDAFVEMFIDEAKLAAQLNHNNITHIYDLGKIGDDYFIAMEFVEGKNLRQLLDALRKKKQTTPVGVALYIVSRLADALDFAHRSKGFDDAALGLVHRDVSPQNVLISYGGDIKLCDFGIAKAVSKISTTKMGALKGKLQYMSPEQAWGKSIDHRSDIFSLGALLFEMLTSERLFTGDSEMAVLEGVRECAVAERIIQSSKIPSGIKGLLLKTLAKEPESRFASAGDLLHGLDQLMRHEGSQPGPRKVALWLEGLLSKQAPGEPELAGVVEPVAEPAEEPIELPLMVESGEHIEAAEAGAELESDTEKARWLRRLLSRLVPAIVLVALGGFLLFDQLGDGKPTRSRSSPEVATLSPAPSFDPQKVSDPNSPPPDIPEPAAAARGPASGTAVARAPEASREEALSEPSAEQDSGPSVAAAERTGDDSGVGAADPTATGSDTGELLAGSAAQGAADPELERRVEQDLQRIQQLISDPSFSAGTEGSAVADVANEPAAPAAAPEASTDLASSESFEDESQAGEVELVESELAPTDLPPVTSSAIGDIAPLAAALRTDVPQTPAELQAAAAASEAASQQAALVTPGPGVIPPQIRRFDKPNYSSAARRLGVAGTVRVAVLVNEQGRVDEVRLIAGLAQQVGLEDAVIGAARTATFRAATKDGVPVRMWHELAVRFAP